MTNEPESFRNEDAIEAKAADWLVEREDGFTPGRAAEFAGWCERDPRHRAALAKLEATHRLLAQLPRLREDTRFAGRLDRMTPPRRARLIPFPRWWAAAAAAAVLAVAAILWWRPGRGEFRQEFASRNGGATKVLLPDTSGIELGANSDVVVNYSRQQRDVALTRGEASFSVAKDPARPFVVTAGIVRVRAVGTVFKVKNSPSAVEVLVTEGQVEVRREGAAPGEVLRSALGAGQRIEIPTEAAAARSVTAAGTAPRPSAIVPERLVFNGTRLGEVVEEFNRRNRIKIVLDDPELADRPVGGTYDADQVEAFVRALENAGEISAEWTNNSTFVLRRGN